MSLPAYKVLGTITVTAAAKVDLATAFATILNSALHSCSVNTIVFSAQAANGAPVLIGDVTCDPAITDSWGQELPAGLTASYSSGIQNSLDPRDFAVSSLSGTVKVRVSILKV